MERLTKKYKDGHIGMNCDEEACMEDGFCPEVYECGFLKDVLNRLSAYEDTDLTPEQITEIDELYRKKCEELAAAQEECIPEKHEGIMRCKCRNGVYGGENYCSKCGRKLKWRRRDK